MVLKRHIDSVRNVAVTCDGDGLVSGSLDRTVRVRNGNTGFETGQFEQISDIRCVAICVDDRTTDIGLENGTLKVIDLYTGRDSI